MQIVLAPEAVRTWNLETVLLILSKQSSWNMSTVEQHHRKVRYHQVSFHLGYSAME